MPKCVLCRYVNVAREFRKHPNFHTSSLFAWFKRNLRRLTGKTCELHQVSDNIIQTHREANRLSQEAWKSVTQ